jgi:hypothetical protein
MNVLASISYCIICFGSGSTVALQARIICILAKDSYLPIASGSTVALQARIIYFGISGG